MSGINVGDIVRIKKCAFEDGGSMDIAESIPKRKERLGAVTYITSDNQPYLVFSVGEFTDDHLWWYTEEELTKINSPLEYFEEE